MLFLFRILVTVFAVLLILVGVVTAPSPLPIGVLFITIGFLLLAAVAPGAVRWLRRRWPWLERQLDRAQKHAPRPIAEVLEKSDIPHEDGEKDDEEQDEQEQDEDDEKRANEGAPPSPDEAPRYAIDDATNQATGQATAQTAQTKSRAHFLRRGRR